MAAGRKRCLMREASACLMGRGRWKRCGGFTFLGLMVMAAVMAIFTMAAHPLWKNIDQREREKELIFRGTQYAHAIERFKRKFGRTPLSLEELYKEKCIPKLYEDPMLPYIEEDMGTEETTEEEGEGSGFDFGFNFDINSPSGFGSEEEEEDEKSYGGWEIVYSTQTGRKRRGKGQPGGQQGQEQQGQQQQEGRRGGKGRGIGGIIGVRTKCELESIGGWPAGQQKAGSLYSEWLFVMNQVDAPWQYPGLGRNPDIPVGEFQSDITLEPAFEDEGQESGMGGMFPSQEGGGGGDTRKK